MSRGGDNKSQKIRINKKNPVRFYNNFLKSLQKQYECCAYMAQHKRDCNKSERLVDLPPYLRVIDVFLI